MNKELIIGVIAMMTLGLIVGISQIYGFIDPTGDIRSDKKAPLAISGDNIYVAWWSNKTGNDEVLFRASNDSGNTFGEKINLSNTTDVESTRAEIDADANNVVVTWWETNQTDDTPVMRVSNDNGKTFGPLLKLGVNGTIGTGEAKPII